MKFRRPANLITLGADVDSKCQVLLKARTHLSTFSRRLCENPLLLRAWGFCKNLLKWVRDLTLYEISLCSRKIIRISHHYFSRIQVPLCNLCTEIQVQGKFDEAFETMWTSASIQLRPLLKMVYIKVYHSTSLPECS